MISAKMNGDESVTLSLNGESTEMTASELDEQIAHLASLRAKLGERVPDDPPQIEEVVINPSYRVRVDRETKASLLRIRHAGYGWLNFEIGPQEALNMKCVWEAIVIRLELDAGNMDAEESNTYPPQLH
jgi:hypothetical protein